MNRGCFVQFLFHLKMEAFFTAYRLLITGFVFFPRTRRWHE
jgi:hypothetical protein